MAGAIRDSYSGANVQADYLYPRGAPWIRCGPMHITEAVTENLTTTNLTVTGAVTLDTVPYVPGPDNYIWVPIGPTNVPASVTPTQFAQIPVGLGSWCADLKLVGTGTVPTDFSHYNMRFNIISTGSSVSVATISSTMQVLNGAMLASPPSVSLVGGTDYIQIEITSPEDSRWVGYIVMVGSAVYTP